MINHDPNPTHVRLRLLAALAALLAGVGAVLVAIQFLQGVLG